MLDGQAAAVCEKLCKSIRLESVKDLYEILPELQKVPSVMCIQAFLLSLESEMKFISHLTLKR